MGVVVFVLMVACMPNLPEGATVPRWAFLSIVSAILFFRVRFGWTTILIGSYLGIMAAVAPIGYDAAFILWHFLLYIVLFLYAQQRLPDLRQVAIGGALGLTVNSAVVLGQWYWGWTFIPQIEPMSGLFYNFNFATEPAAMVMALVVGHRLWWLIPGLLPTLLTGSRAPILALGLAAMLALWRRGNKWDDPLNGRFVAILAMLAAALFILARGKTGIYISEDLAQRFAVWRDTVPHVNFFGHGIGSFIADFPTYQTHINALSLRFEHAHNDYLQVAYELGIGGLILLVVLAARMYVKGFSGRKWERVGESRNPEWYAMIVFLGIAVFDFPLYEPCTGTLAALCAGRLFAGCPGLRDLLASWRFRLWDRAKDAQPVVFSVCSAVFSAHPFAPQRPRLPDRPGRRSGRHPLDRGGIAA